MARLVYTAIASLDGFVNDADGGFDWAAPDEQVHAFVNEMERSIGTHLLGARMYAVLRFWDTDSPEIDDAAVTRDYAAVWRATDKVVYSTTLEDVGPRARLERRLDPAAVAALKAGSDRDLGIGGPGLAAAALKAGLVDELNLFVVPVVVGGGTRWLPADLSLRLHLVEERRFDGGFVLLRYRLT